MSMTAAAASPSVDWHSKSDNLVEAMTVESSAPSPAGAMNIPFFALALDRIALTQRLGRPLEKFRFAPKGRAQWRCQARRGARSLRSP
jgi:hypothetical protein